MSLQRWNIYTRIHAHTHTQKHTQARFSTVDEPTKVDGPTADGSWTIVALTAGVLSFGVCVCVCVTSGMLFLQNYQPYEDEALSREVENGAGAS